MVDQQLFDAGKVHSSDAIKRAYPVDYLKELLSRHVRGLWGQPEDWADTEVWGEDDHDYAAANRKALADGGEIISLHRQGTDSVMIRTAADRSFTRISFLMDMDK